MKKNFNNATEALNFSAKVRKFLYKHIIGKTICDGVQNQMRLFGG